MTNTERRPGQQLEKTEPGRIAETLVNLDEVHRRLATGWGGGSAARIGPRCLPAFLGETLGLALAENHVKMFAGRFDFQDRVLRDDAAIVFHLDLELIMRQHPLAE